jgi:integrase
LARIEARLGMGETFSSVAREFVSKCARESFAPATLAKAEWFIRLLDRDIGNLPIRDITPHEMLAALKRIEARGHRETARRARSFASRVFRYGIATLRAERDPCVALRGALTVPVAQHYSAIIDPARFGRLLQRIELYSGRQATRFALRIAPHVFARPGELRQAVWSEFDLERAVWRIPAGRMKARREHAVPLSAQVCGLLRELAARTGTQGYLFKAQGCRNRPLCENTLNSALRRLGYGPDEMSAHGFRASASTLLNESGLWSEDAIERALAHGDRNVIRAIYHRGRHWDERVRMAQWWSDYLDELRGPRELWQLFSPETRARRGSS